MVDKECQRQPGLPLLLPQALHRNADTPGNAMARCHQCLVELLLSRQPHRHRCWIGWDAGLRSWTASGR